ncbi:hypothetical protein Plim_0968 [Planctopirus limnophila DSM 3776]|uniref:Uncharacterized protein n=1 Tax=Planctopirus limnophila (strain ATCC 43296 / DSM 3776 / IFAM 1008 / Mu 290) TaxID=521674 RepID=D5ST44_PLAL2|nr:hypothetical protein Plim_0968 [Planctopirus limnophila DSM 3776]
MMGTVLESPPIEATLRECHRQHQFRFHEHQLHIVRHIHQCRSRAVRARIHQIRILG